MAKTPEKKVQDSIEEYFKKLKLEGHPIYFERRQAGGFSGKEGLPDLFGFYNGLHFEIECKQLFGEARTRQERYEREFKAKGAIYLRPDCLQEVKELFEEKIIPICYPPGAKK